MDGIIELPVLIGAFKKIGNYIYSATASTKKSILYALVLRMDFCLQKPAIRWAIKDFTIIQRTKCVSLCFLPDLSRLQMLLHVPY
jgi:hypothetical protein